MNATKATRGFFFGVAAAVVTVLATAGDKEADESPLDKETYQAVMAGEAHEPGDLLARYDEARWLYLPILPPDPDFVLHQPIAGPVVPFEWKNFPENFNEGLLPRWENTVPVFDLTLAEDPLTRETIFYNGLGAPIWRVAPEPGYDPWSFQRALSPLALSGDMSADAFYLARRLWDPARLQGRLTLIRPEHVEYYLYAAAKVAEAAASLQTAEPESGGGGMMMMLLGDPEFEFSAITRLTNGLQLTVTFPSEFTNRMDIFSSTNLVGFSWQVAASTLSTTGGSPLVWTDTSFPSTWRVYAAGDADLDSDSDGLANAREFFVYGTCPTNLDTDADGLVDGYSGVVGTNLYSGGVHSNGNGYVEGELSWGTSALLGDTDDDGVSDGDEVAGGTDPLDPDHPPSAGGTVSYSGQQTGAVFVVAVLASNDWSRTHSASNSAPGAYRVGGLSSNVWYLKAYRDSNGNTTNDVYEAAGIYSGNPVLTTNRVCGVDIVLEDPDSDEDGLPDWWEVSLWTNLTAQAGWDDLDDDGWLNADEYDALTDPEDPDSHPFLIAGTYEYSGLQDGPIYVLATAESNSWDAALYASLDTETNAYWMVRLPVGATWHVKAWCDSDWDGERDEGEAWGQYTPGLYLDQHYTNIVVTLSDPDSDGDALPDYWELEYGFDPSNGSGVAAAAWWQMDGSGSETNVADSSEDGNDGALIGGGTNNWGEGAVSNSLTLDGVSQYVEVADGDALQPEFVSVAMWVCPSAMVTGSASAVFLSKRQTGTDYGFDLAYSNGQVRFTICSSGAKTVGIAATLTNGVWRHLAGTYGGANHRLYLDGQLAAWTNYSWGTGMGSVQHTNTPLRLGATPDATPARFFGGGIDDVQLYASELSSNQVWAIYEVGADFDGDGLRSTPEAAQNSDPWTADTDQDGMGDAAEWQAGTSARMQDTDSDGLSDAEEQANGLNAKSYDVVVDVSPLSVETEYKLIASQRQKCGFDSLVSTTSTLFFLRAELPVNRLDCHVTNIGYMADVEQHELSSGTQTINATNGVWTASGHNWRHWRYMDMYSNAECSLTIHTNSWAYQTNAPWGSSVGMSSPAYFHSGTGTSVDVASNPTTVGYGWTNASNAWQSWCGVYGGSSVSGALYWTSETVDSAPSNLTVTATATSGAEPGDGSSERTEMRTQEFTTSLLHFLATGDLTRTSWTNLEWGKRCDWVDDSEVISWGGEPWQDPQGSAARRWMASDETSLHLARLMYRFRVPNPQSGTVYRVHALYIFEPEGTGAISVVLSTNLMRRCESTNETFYINPDGTVIEPPSTDGTVTLERHNVRFVADTNQLYGFDDITSPSVPWKSVEVGSNDVVGLSVDLETDCINVHLVAGQAETTISPTVATNAVGVATIGRSATGTGTVSACYLTTNGTTLARMKVASYTPIRNKVIVIPLNEQNDDVQAIPQGTSGLQPYDVVISNGANGVMDTATDAGDFEYKPFFGPRQICAGTNGVADTAGRTNDTVATLPFTALELSEHLNRIYAQAIVEWDVELRPAESFNYDLDRDGTCLRVYVGNESSTTDEAYRIWKRFSPRPQASNEYVVVVMASTFNLTNLHGTAVMEKSHLVLVAQNATNVLDVCAHELGHCLDLTHSIENPFGVKPPTLKRCLMWPRTVDRTGTQLRKEEWDAIRGSKARETR